MAIAKAQKTWLLVLLVAQSGCYDAAPVAAVGHGRPPAKPFPGVDVFHGGEGGYACFRLPALLRLPSADGRSLALYAEGRLKSCSDFAPIDLVYKISRNNGLSWSNISILCTDGCTTHHLQHTFVVAWHVHLDIVHH